MAKAMGSFFKGQTNFKSQTLLFGQYAAEIFDRCR
jgi:hypothetical protein